MRRHQNPKRRDDADSFEDHEALDNFAAFISILREWDEEQTTDGDGQTEEQSGKSPGSCLR